MKKIGLFCAIALLFTAKTGAHTINYELAAMPKDQIGWQYLRLGFEHIVPLGLDHILFVLCLFLLSTKLKTILWQATAFTVAHSITLGLAMNGFLKPLPTVIEPIIALSIFFVAMENLLVDQLRPGRVAVVFGFGLVHGLGFAGALSGLGLPPTHFMLSLVSFNIGVELGQVCVILLAWLAVGRWFSGKEWYRSRVVSPASLAIAAVAIFWTVERAFL